MKKLLLEFREKRKQRLLVWVRVLVAGYECWQEGVRDARRETDGG
jgi:hypothetical protein